ncbi:MAG TPA: mechanosensitive ion channel family protein [Thermoplasmata archaeon]|nr:mechanosensitive ion channel family protein [Thermoplasmata archaeon]
MAAPRTRRHWIVAGAGAVVAVVGASAAYVLLSQLHYIPAGFQRYFEAVLVAVFGVLALSLIGRALRKESEQKLGPSRANQVLDVYRLFAYVVLALLVLYALGVNGTALLAGGTFAGLVIGLAAQTALGNVIAGVMLLVVRPFAQGDRVTVTTWQYPFLGPAYPPKFFSDDLLILGFTGVVHSIGLAYSVLRRDDGTVVRLPNNILIQAAVVSHEVTQRWVRTKYEVPPQIDPKVLLPKVRERIAANEWVSRPETVTVSVSAATMTSYVIVVDALCRGALEEPPRSAFLIELIDIVAGLRTPAKS